MSDTPRKASLLVIFPDRVHRPAGLRHGAAAAADLRQGFCRAVGARRGARARSGVVIGLLMSSFSIMQFLFAPLWGRLSDRIGRRPVLMIGLAGSVVFYTLFGIATVLQKLAAVVRIADRGGHRRRHDLDRAGLHRRRHHSGKPGQGHGPDRRRVRLGIHVRSAVRFSGRAQRAKATPARDPAMPPPALSAIALALAYFKLPESLTPGKRAARAPLVRSPAPVASAGSRRRWACCCWRCSCASFRLRISNRRCR